MDVHQINHKDEYIECMRWFKLRTGMPLHHKFLSNYGFMASENKEWLACVFVYPAFGSDICWLGWHMAKPGITARKTAVALDAVYKAAEDFAKKQGYSMVTTYTARPLFGKRLKRHGWRAGDKGLTQYLKFLGS